MTARLAPQLRIESRFRQREIAFACAWVLRRQPLDALDPSKRWLAGMDRAIYLYELRVGSRPPCAFYRLCSRSRPPVVQQQSRVMGSGSSEVGRQPLGLRRQIYPAAPVAVRHRGAAELVKDHAAMMAGAFARDGSTLDRLREGLVGRLPPSLTRLQIEQALDHPRGARAQRHGALGEPQCGTPIAHLQRLVQESA